jgi:tol-pal system protein YbgF
MPPRLVRALAAAALCGIVAPAFAQDAGEFVVRMNRLENQARQMSGQIEQLQFENRQLKDQLRKFQEDVEFRFQERGGAARATPGPAGTQPAAPPAAATPPAVPGVPARPQRRGDAFDPNLTPSAPGAPMPLGTTPPSAPLPRGTTERGPTIGSLIEEEEEGAEPSAPLDLGATGHAAAAVPQRPPPSVAATGSGDPRADYDIAYAYILQRQYEQAEMGLRQFLQSHPRDRLVPDAIYWLGESYLQRNRPREAAEQFLRISTEHARSAKAPDAMLKLGVSLNALGAREQACATLAEVGRKYPDASPTVRQGVEREQKRARCT